MDFGFVCLYVPYFTKQTENGSDHGHKQKDNGQQRKRGRCFSDVGPQRTAQSMDQVYDVQASEVLKNEENQEDLWGIYADGACKELHQCIAIKRIICALGWYSNANGDADVLWKCIKDKQYGSNLINDYHHIMTYHVTSFDGDLQLLQKEKMAICELIYQSISKCDPNNCLGYKRKQIERLEQKNDKYLYGKCQNRTSSSSALHNAQGGHIPYYVNCMDTIHCHFMHSPSTKLDQQSLAQ